MVIYKEYNKWMNNSYFMMTLPQDHDLHPLWSVLEEEDLMLRIDSILSNSAVRLLSLQLTAEMISERNFCHHYHQWWSVRNSEWGLLTLLSSLFIIGQKVNSQQKCCLDHWELFSITIFDIWIGSIGEFSHFHSL